MSRLRWAELNALLARLDSCSKPSISIQIISHATRTIGVAADPELLAIVSCGDYQNGSTCDGYGAEVRS